MVTKDLLNRKQNLINRMGIDAYMKSFKEYLSGQPLTKEQRFDEYYRVWVETKALQS